MGYYPPNTQVSTAPLVPVMDGDQMFRANLARTSRPLSADRCDAHVMDHLTGGRKHTRPKDWPAQRRKILGAWDLVTVKSDPTLLRWAK